MTSEGNRYQHSCGVLRLMKRYLLTIVLVLVAANSYAFNFASFDFVGGNRKCTDLLPNPAFSPTSKAFGEKDTGTTTDQVFTLSNSGTAQLSAASLSVTGTSFTLLETDCGENPFDLAASASCTATVRFAPLTAAAFTGSLTMSAVNLDDAVASLSGTGISAGDSTPDAFSFTDQTDVALSTTITSAPITVAGIDTASAISVTGGTYDINASDTFVSSSGTVSNGDTVRARHTSSASNSATVDTVVTIGGVSDTFTSTTIAASGVTVQDNFNRANQNPLRDGYDTFATPTGTWGTVSGYANAYIYSSRAEASATVPLMYWAYNTFNDNQWASLTTTVTSGTSVAVRLNSSNGDRYSLNIYASTIELKKRVSGVTTVLHTYTVAHGSTKVYRLEADGTTITVKVDGTPLSPTLTDSSLTGGTIGFSIQAYGNADNFKGGDL